MNVSAYQLYQGDCRDLLDLAVADKSIQTCVTSPPYFGLRDYGHAGQIGLESTPDEYVAKLVAVFREVRRVLRDDGTLWLNLGDSYARQGGTDRNVTSTGKVGLTLRTLKQLPNRDQFPPDGLKAKDLIGIPWRVAFALQADGWYLRQDIIWSKPNPMPESVTDRCTKAHEYVFLLSKSERYYCDMDAVKLIEPCILAGCPPGGVVLDPFAGSGTTAKVALQHGRRFMGMELNPEYIALANKRVNGYASLEVLS